MELIFETIPASRENPLLETRKFADYCKKRFQGVFALSFPGWLEDVVGKGLLRPAYAQDAARCYATYQVWQVHHLLRHRTPSADTLPSHFTRFDTLVRLFAQIQDWYLPEVRSDQRVGLSRDYRGTAVLEGTWFCTNTSYDIGFIRDWRRREVQEGRLQPRSILVDNGLTAADLRRWIGRLVFEAKHFDPMADWYPMIRFVAFEKRQRLKYESLLAQDFLEMAEMLRLFHRDASDEPVVADILDANPDGGRSGSAEAIRDRRYGSSVSKPIELLEFAANEYGLNPKPRAVVLTEGHECRALHLLYEAVGAYPTHLGIEFRPLGGVGNFSVQNWQCFVEYMHEKQTLVYFVLDREGRAAKEARRLLTGKRKFTFPGLTKVIPSQDRICLWDSSFEEANFTDGEIVHALRLQGVTVGEKSVSAARGGKKGLIEALIMKANTTIDKPKLCVDLVKALVAWREANPDAPMRQVETFVQESAQLIALNHQPASEEIRLRNIATRLLG